MQEASDPELGALEDVREVRIAELSEGPPYDFGLLLIVGEDDLPDGGAGLARLVGRMRDWFVPDMARLVDWAAVDVYQITVGDYLDSERIYLDHYTYRGQTFRGLAPPPML